jgi:hypothetical protein
MTCHEAEQLGNSNEETNKRKVVHNSRSISLNSDARKLRSGESNSFKSGERPACLSASAEKPALVSSAGEPRTLCHRAGQSLVFIPVDDLYHLYKKSVPKVSNKMRTLTFITNNFAPPLQMIIVHPKRAALAMDGI